MEEMYEAFASISVDVPGTRESCFITTDTACRHQPRMEKNGRSTPSVQNTLPHQLQMFLRGWENPVLQVVLDCSSAGVLMAFFTAPMTDPSVVPSWAPPRAQTNPTNLREQASEWVSDTVVLCPCSESEWLPMNPDYPVDIFTSCLTTPLKIALRWFIHKASLHPDAVDHFPGVFNDRKTPL